MKPKYITPDNYQQFKPSELVHSFISDIEVAEKMKRPMNMGNWDGYGECLPCLGGMACLNWNISPWPQLYYGTGNAISNLGDDIRSGYDIKPTLSELYPAHHFSKILPSGVEMFSADEKIKTKAQFTALKHQVMLYVKELEKQGL